MNFPFEGRISMTQHRLCFDSFVLILVLQLEFPCEMGTVYGVPVF